MALMPRYAYQRREDGDLEVMPLPPLFWIIIIMFIIGGFMLVGFFSQHFPDDYQIDHLKLEQTDE